MTTQIDTNITATVEFQAKLTFPCSMVITMELKKNKIQFITYQFETEAEFIQVKQDSKEMVNNFTIVKATNAMTHISEELIMSALTAVHRNIPTDTEIQTSTLSGLILGLGVHGFDFEMLGHMVHVRVAYSTERPTGDETSLHRCNTCYLVKPLTEIMSCPCKRTEYCGKVCQKKDWKEHKKTCPCKK